MREFVCSECREIEVVTDSTTVVVHAHGNDYFQLMQIQGAPLDNKEHHNSLFMKELQLIEFDPSKVYLVLVNPVDIDLVQLVKGLDTLQKRIKADCLFVPCRFSQNGDGFVTEMIAIESLDIIEEWLKERKENIKCNERDIIRAYGESNVPYSL